MVRRNQGSPSDYSVLRMEYRYVSTEYVQYCIVPGADGSFEWIQFLVTSMPSLVLSDLDGENIIVGRKSV